MHTRRVKRARDDLHGVFMRPVAPDIGNVAATVHQHGVPRKQGPIVELRSMAAINIGHEFGGPGLRPPRAALVGGKAQMPCERPQDAGAVEDLALDGRAIDNLLRDEFDGQAIALIGVQVVERADDDARAFQEFLF